MWYRANGASGNRRGFVVRATWIRAITISAALLLAGATQPPPAWLYPPRSSTVPRPPVPHALAGSTLHPTDDELETMTAVVDWYPGDHPAAPAAVMGPTGKANACGYCHMPNGAGRPENASLAGLDAAYIRRAVHAYVSGTRESSEPTFLAFKLMRLTALAADDATIDAAAQYFSRLPRHAFGRVVESAAIPVPIGDAMVYRPDPSGKREALGDRLIEMPDDFGRFEARDSHLGYTAYVPPGAIAQGATLASGMAAAGPPACTACHGGDYNGTAIAPPLAGRSPTYLARQLINYRSGARHADEAVAMHAVAAHLTDHDVIALAAFMASRPVPRAGLPRTGADQR